MNELNTENTTKEKQSSNFIRRIFKAILALIFWSVASFSVLVIILVFALQFSSVRSKIIPPLVDLVNSALIAKIEVDDIRFTGFPNLELEGVRLITEGDTLASISRIFVEADIPAILDNKIEIRNVLLQSPNIKLLRNSVTGVWNFERIAPPADSKKSPSETETILKVGELLIDNARIDFTDSLSLKSHNYVINPGHFNADMFKLRDFSLRLSADFNLKRLIGSANIKQMQFREAVSGLYLENFVLSADILDNEIKLNKLKIKTPKTNFNLMANAQGISLSKPINDTVLKNLNIKAKIYDSHICISDVERFVSLGINTLTELDLTADISGKLNNIKIDKLIVKPENSNLELSGTLRGITDGNIQYSAHIKDSKFFKKDLIYILPKSITNSLPDFSSITLENIRANGSTTGVNADIKIISDLGNIKGKADLQFSPKFKYSASLNFQNVNIAKIAKDASLSSNLTGAVSVKGVETDLKKLNAQVQLDLLNSQFQKFTINKLDLNLNIANSRLNIDTLHLEMPRKYYSEFITKYYTEEPRLDLSGFLDISDMKNPKYEIKLATKALNLASIIENREAPEYLSAQFDIKGMSFNPDNMNTNVLINFDDIVFDDKSVMPFALDIKVNTTDTNHKYVKIESEILNIDLQGKFTVAALAAFGAHQGQFWAMSVFNKMEQLNDINYIPEKFNWALIPAEFDLKAEIKDLSVANTFLTDEKLYSNINIELSGLIREHSANLQLKRVDISKFQFESNYYNMLLNNFNMSGIINIKSNESTWYLDTCILNLPQANGLAKINDLKLIDPEIHINMNNDMIKYSGYVNMNDEMKFNNVGTILFDKTAMQMNSELFAFNYMNTLNLHNTDPISFKLENGAIEIQNLNVSDKYGTYLSALGTVSLERYDSLKIAIKGLDIQTLDTLFNKFGMNYLDIIDGRINSIYAVADGDLKNPKYSIDLSTDNIYADNQKAGILNFHFDYANRIAKGKGVLTDSITNRPLFYTDIKSFPIDLAVFDVTDRMPKSAPISITANSDSLPLHIAAPFIPAITKLKGYLGLNLSIEGQEIEKLDYRGELNIPKFDFVLDANNMNYNGKAKVVFNSETVELKETVIYNNYEDYRNGSAELEGKIDLSGFNIDEFNFRMKSKGLMVLNQASVKAIPMIYGNLLVSTGSTPLSVRGNLNYINISGDVNLINGSLFMPQLKSNNATQSRMLYKVLARDNDNQIYYKVINNATGDTLYSETNSIKDTTANLPIDKVNYASISDNITMNINFRIINPISLKMDLGIMGMLATKIGTANSTIPLNFDFNSKADIKMNGEIQLLDGSKLTYGKQFDTEGKISFPFGTVTNPYLNLKATYNGKSYINDKMRDFKVYLYITGTKDLPSIQFDYLLDGENAKGDSTQISQDALYLILLGRTKTEMEAGASAGGSDFGSLGMSGITAAFSKTMTELLAGTGNIESAEIDMGNTNNWQDARLKVSGRLFDNVAWRIGGDLNDITNNSEFSLDIPLGIVLHPDYLNNIVWQISRSTNSQQTSINRSQKEWELKLKFGGSW